MLSEKKAIELSQFKRNKNGYSNNIIRAIMVLYRNGWHLDYGLMPSQEIDDIEYDALCFYIHHHLKQESNQPIKPVIIQEEDCHT